LMSKSIWRQDGHTKSGPNSPQWAAPSWGTRSMARERATK